MTEPIDPQQNSAADDFLRDMDQQITEIRAGHDARLLTDSADPADVSARLWEMFELDQYARHRVDAAHDAGADGDELRELQSEVSARITAVDLEHTSELKGFVQSHGWLKLSEYGEDTVDRAWLIVQHADRDPEFQRDVLQRMDALQSEGEINAKNFAYLWDRVAVAQDRPQRFGTQGRCVGPGTWEPREVEDPEQLDERRLAIGLQTMAEYKKAFIKLCR